MAEQRRNRGRDPVRARREVKTLKIDGLDVSGTDDQTILEVAREHDIYIPTLCTIEGLANIGACRICLVELEGANRLMPACSTLIDEGLVVNTKTPRIIEYRRKLVELLFSERNHICAVCVSNGDCELQSLAEELGVDHTRYPHVYPKMGLDATRSAMIVDHNRCVLCQRCVRVCDSIEGAHTWDVMERGEAARVVTDMHENWGDSKTCTECGKCLQVCPTGALFKKGCGVAEMTKETEFLPYLQIMREERE